MSANWEAELEEVWSTATDRPDAELRAAVEELALRCPYDDGTADFERAGAWDSIGHPEEAIELYEQALDSGLGPERRRRAVIQLASSLRNVGRVEDSIRLLEEELKRDSDELDDAIVAFLALARASSGDDRAGLALALQALSKHLPRYQRSVSNYAKHLLDPSFFDG